MRSSLGESIKQEIRKKNGRLSFHEGIGGKPVQRSKNETAPAARDSVIKAFKILISKYNPSGAQDPFDRRVESDPLEQVEEKEGSLHQLRFDFLPLLDDQIVSLLRSLDLTRLRKEPMLALELISDIQSELDQTLDSIQYAISITCPKPHASSSDRLNDQHLKDFKLFRVDGLHHMFITNVMESVIPMFRLSYRLLQQLKLSTKEYKYATRINRTKKSIVEHGTSSCNEIQSTLGWVEDSEFDTIRFGWPDQADLIDDQLEQISRLINQEPHYVEEYFREVTLSKQVMELAKSIVPIVKLSRLFLNKLSAQGIDRNCSQCTRGCVPIKLTRYLFGGVSPSHNR
ncbi:hypothetical protein H4Q26_009374 [Puccinia striiformis f. sp. tritici PST-130]|nr:hypothetical protein H4Q26_009374 [Puccinia striiformis f. sp. tritici PST-130]